MLKSMMLGSARKAAKPWVALLGGRSYDYGRSVAVAPDDSVYVCGNTGSDFLLAKFNSSGSIQWQKTLGGSKYEEAFSVAVAPDGSIYVCGYTASAGAGSNDILLAKFNSSGSTQWKKTLGGSGDDYGQSVAVTSGGSVYVCGRTNSAGVGGSYDILLVKLNSSGTVQWKRVFGDTGDDYGYSVAVAPDDSVYVCGYIGSGGAGYSDFILVKFNSSGSIQWQKTLGGSKYDYGQSVAVAPDGSIYVCGYTASAGAGSQDFLLAKFNSSGSIQWQKTLGGGSSDYGQSVAVASDGSVYVCGISNSAGSGSQDLLLAKFNSSGSIQWQKTLGGSRGDYGQSVAVAPDDSVYVCGYTGSAGAGYDDILLAKITESLIEKNKVTFGKITLKDASLSLKNVSLTSKSSSLFIGTPGLTVKTPSLTLKTSSLTTNLFPYTE